MNKARRQRVDTALGRLQEALDILYYVQEEEQEAFDNMPETLQESEKGEVMEEGLCCLSDAVDDIDSTMENLKNWTAQWEQ